MEYQHRVYKRSTFIDCQGQVSSDQINWVNINVQNLSSGGMKFTVDNTYNDFKNASSLYCRLTINHMLANFSFKCQGRVVSFQPFDRTDVYGLMFLNLDEGTKIRIDENISAVTPVNRNGYTQ